MNSTPEMRDEQMRKEKMLMFPRKSKGGFEKESVGRASTGTRKYRKAFAKVKNLNKK